MLAAPDLFCQAMPCGAIAGRSGRQDPRVRRELSMDVAGPANTRPLREELLRLFDDRSSFETCLDLLKPCPAPPSATGTALTSKHHSSLARV